MGSARSCKGYEAVGARCSGLWAGNNAHGGTHHAAKGDWDLWAPWDQGRSTEGARSFIWAL